MHKSFTKEHTDSESVSLKELWSIHITFAFCNVILDLGNISFDKSMQWMNKI